MHRPMKKTMTLMAAAGTLVLAAGAQAHTGLHGPLASTLHGWLHAAPLLPVVLAVAGFWLAVRKARTRN